ncbi:ABC-type transport system, involved in lipoprotein release, permease component [Dyadobacter koreensis]|uniref:ABC-type transport system, involved in lipoprotein release, permease component n=1 Tax=Dyadobacter koreensis TaxID=408657 RepID=A0A1H6U2A6_9BACT|nr:ABC transporter permease [Dyadobacter koreensis]SEI82092.1 ABC-type transport system, involved in lipoprotein release, permease component [Dyadobacter koreensis]
MINNYFKIAFRNLWKSKGYASINIVGLAVAFCISTFLFLTAYFQLSFDDFHKDGDRIFQTYIFANKPEKEERGGSMPMPLTPALKAEYPEVEAAARLMNGSSLVEYNGKYFDKQVMFTDPDFLKIFTFPLLKGNSEAALNELSNIVISQNMAKAVFGNEDPMGKQIQLGSGGGKQYIVSGVVQDFPGNSTIQYDAFIRIENNEGYQRGKDQWDAMSHQVYLKLKPNADQVSFEKRLKSFSAKYFADNITTLKKQGAKPDERGDIFAIRLQKLKNFHFNKDISGGASSSILIYALMGIASFILLIACINFINLSVARSFTRAREVGVRKSLGALKKQLFVQIWGETSMICFVGFIVGLLLAYSLLPQFNATFRSKLTLEYVFQPDTMALIIGLFLLVTFIAGGYPAWQMSKFNAVEVLKGKITLKRPGILRNSLIVTQFTLSSLLICCTIIALQQVDFLRNQPVGFDKEQVISIPVGNKVDGQQVLRRMRNTLDSDPSILEISGSAVNLGVGKDHSTSRSVIGFTFKDKEISSDWVSVDYGFVKTLGIKLLDGREFDPAYPTDSLDRVIITETMAKMIGEKDPVGKYFQTDTAGVKYQIIGLVPDFHIYSLKADQKPITLHLSHSEPINYIFVRVSPQSLVGSMDKLQAVWKEVAPQADFIATYMDENTDAWYKEEDRLSQVFSLASGVAILLSCLGLFAVALMVIEQRTKEIGVRKVLGASIRSIVYTLSEDFVKMVILSIIIATPLAWFLMQKWLDNYTYRIEISGWIFILVGCFAVLIALATVSFQSIRAALMNPVKSLKSE